MPEDYNIKRGHHCEGIADQHMTAYEYKKAATLYKDAFNNFKKGGSKDDALRIKDKYEDAIKKMKEN